MSAYGISICTIAWKYRDIGTGADRTQYRRDREILSRRMIIDRPLPLSYTWDVGATSSSLQAYAGNLLNVSTPPARTFRCTDENHRPIQADGMHVTEHLQTWEWLGDWEEETTWNAGVPPPGDADSSGLYIPVGTTTQTTAEWILLRNAAEVELSDEAGENDPAATRYRREHRTFERIRKLTNGGYESAVGTTDFELSAKMGDVYAWTQRERNGEALYYRCTRDTLEYVRDGNPCVHRTQTWERYDDWVADE